MPVRLASNLNGPDRSTREQPCADDAARPSDELVIGLLNNMSSIEATEHQFRALLDSASNGRQICLRRFYLPEASAGESAAIYAQRGYESVEVLSKTRLDGLIITGREPIASSLKEEPYWDSFVRVLEWARVNTYSAIWSCLAAHAAALSMDGIQRVKSTRKHSGIFDCTRTSEHSIAADIPEKFRIPHSRWNGLIEADLTSCGYEVISRTADAGVDCFIKADRSLFLFFQGHPEYQAETLLLEYRRDVGRYLRGESAGYPNAPLGYFDPETLQRLSEIQSRAAMQAPGETAAQLAAVFSTSSVKNGWHSTASTLYRNWLKYIQSQKELSPCDKAMDGAVPDGNLFDAFSPAPSETCDTTAV
jgi:homoserine O-succinyltransferase/O-acetyltransferase